MKDRVPHVLSGSSYSLRGIQEKEGESTKGEDMGPRKQTSIPERRYRNSPVMPAGDSSMAATQQVLGVGAQTLRHILRATH